MSKISKAVKYFRKSVSGFFDHEYNLYDKEIPQEHIDLLYAYTNYLKNHNYADTFNESAVQQTLKDFGDEVNEPKFFAEGVQAMRNHAEPIIILLQKENASLKRQLVNQKTKQRDIQAKMLATIKELEQKLGTPQPVMAKMHLAFIAGTKAMQLVERKPLNPELPPYVTLQKGMGFRQWANQIYKYGKSKMTMPTNNYPNIKFGGINEAPLGEIRPQNKRGANMMRNPVPQFN